MSYAEMCVRDAEKHIFGQVITASERYPDNYINTLTRESAHALSRIDADQRVSMGFIASAMAGLRSAAHLEGLDQVSSEVPREVVKKLFHLFRPVANPLFCSLVGLLDPILRKLDLPDPFVELGSGMGVAAAVHFSPRKLTVGSDPNLVPLRSCHGGPYQYLMTIDSAAIPFADGSIGTVLAENTIYHSENKLGSIREMARVVRPGGMLVFNDITPLSREVRPLTKFWRDCGFKKSAENFDLFLQSGNRYKENYNDVQAYTSPDEYKSLLSSLGFENITVIPYFSKHLLAVAYYLFDFTFIMGSDFMPVGDPVTEAFYGDFLENVIAPMIAMDGEWCAAHGEHGYQLIIARKGERGVSNPPLVVCPIDKSALRREGHVLRSIDSGRLYPVFKDISMVMPAYHHWYVGLPDKARAFMAHTGA